MITYVCGPFRKESKTLQQRVLVGGKTQLIPFDVQIYWSKQSESGVEFRHGGVTFKSGSTFNDYYGFMTSKESAIENAQQVAEKLKVTPQSSLVLAVKTTVREVPFIRTARCEMSDLSDDKRRHALENIPDDWYDGETRLEAKVLESFEAWTSKQ
jgi:hypothetical protein